MLGSFLNRTQSVSFVNLEFRKDLRSPGLAPENARMEKRIIFLAGLPRSGSTVLANILGMHPRIHATPSSPLATLVDGMRQSWSQDSALLAQLDANYEQVYQRLLRSTRAFMEAWSSDTERPLTVDKSRYWLHLVETLRALYPEFKLIICLRDLRDIYKSIEVQHRKTLMLTFPGRLEQNLVEARAMQLFSPGGVVGGPLKALQNLNDIPDVRPHLYFWRFEAFLKDPAGSTEEVLRWMAVEPTSIPLETIAQTTQESDSHYHFKFIHQVSPRLTPPGSFGGAGLSSRILSELVTKNLWYYRQFYAPDGVIRLGLDSPGAA